MEFSFFLGSYICKDPHAEVQPLENYSIQKFSHHWKGIFRKRDRLHKMTIRIFYPWLLAGFFFLARDRGEHIIFDFPFLW